MYMYKEYMEIFKINKIEINTKYGINNLVMVIINFKPDKKHHLVCFAKYLLLIYLLRK